MTNRASGRGDDITDEGALFVHPSAVLAGRIRLGPGSSIWPNVVIRAEAHEVVVGEDTNIQDFVMIHVGFATPSVIGPRCSVTHHCTVHGATIEADCLIGIGATIMDGAIIGAGSIVAGHTIVTEGTVIPPRSVVAGVPGKVVAQRDARLENRLNAHAYRRNAEAWARGEHRLWASEAFDAELARMRTELEAELARE